MSRYRIESVVYYTLIILPLICQLPLLCGFVSIGIRIRVTLYYIIFTDISRDGSLKGPNLDMLKALSESISCDITASGGIKDLDDIRAVKAMGLYGAICGKSLYSGTLALEEALKVARA